MNNIIIKRISQSEILNNPNNFNSNNHWDISIPYNYDFIVNETNTKNWINLFHNDYKTIKIKFKDLKWTEKAYDIGKITGVFPKSFNDELIDLCNKYSISNFEFKEGYFVRTEKASLKYGIHGCGPYFNVKQIIESICTTTAGHRCINYDKDRVDIEYITFYLMKWRNDISINNEFRVFVYKNNITAISQQAYHSIIQTLNNKSDEELKYMAYRLIKYFKENIKNKISNILDSYVMDIVYINEIDDFYFIEPNPFGKEYSSGSALFHWINDTEILYNDKEDIYIEFRITSS
jgi:hypothetical protein